MNTPRVMVLLVALLTFARAAERLPIEDFARTPETSNLRLSPDGKYFAYLREHDRLTKLHIAEVESKNTIRLNIGEAVLANGARKDVAGFSWISEKRLMVTTAVWDLMYGVMAVDRDGAHQVAISGFEDEQVRLQTGTRIFAREVIHRFYDKDERVLMLDRHEDGAGAANRPDVLSVDTLSGLASLSLKNPGEVSAWAVDGKGAVRVGILSHGDQSGVIYRENEKAPWRTVLPLKDRRGGMRPVGFDSANEKIFVAALTNKQRWTIFPLDPANGEMGEPLLTDDEYDILPEHFIPSMDGVSLAAPVFSKSKDSLLGVRYVNEAPRVKWFDHDFADYQRTIDNTLKDTMNLLVDVSLDGKRLLWLGFSDRNPGTYYFVDLEAHKFKPLASRMSWIKPAQMAQMLAIKYTARDGLLIHGFLTVPVGHQPKNLPLVVLPHGGPWVRDVWEFDPLVQLLANRGYAVLQMNYRGSPGYGDELFRNARRQIGGKIQDDIEDATLWAIKAGVADPKRIAIMGMSYGGYSTLFALGHNPELYRCGISMAGVTDWPAIYTKSDVAEYKESQRYWREQIGDPSKDGEFLRSISPVNFADKITAPLLIIQGKEDRRVPPDQARRMISALDKAGHKPENLILSGVAHNFGKEKDRVQILKAIVAFLEKNLGPGVE